MADLTVDFCGLELRNPIVLAASPATETISRILRVADAGPGAMIVKSIANHHVSRKSAGFRRVFSDKHGLWATSTFFRESLSIDEGVELVREATRRCSIPMIASVADLSLEPANWLPTCNALVRAGAKMLQLDLFYLPQPLVSAETFSAIVRLCRELTGSLAVPVIAKLNVEMPAYLVAEQFTTADVSGLSLLDSIRVPTPYRAGDVKPAYEYVSNLGMSSVFGQWQFPLTLHYTFVLARLSRIPLCAGGGVTSAEDALLLLRYGARCVQIASVVLLDGPDVIPRMNTALQHLMSDFGVSAIEDLIGTAVPTCRTDAEAGECVFQRAVVKIDPGACRQCRNCTSWTFCSAIRWETGEPTIDEGECDGCGFCIQLCPYEARSLQQKPEV